MAVDQEVINILAAVAAPLDPADIKSRHDNKTNKDLRYIDARVVITRLNTVCPGLWESYIGSLTQGNDGRWVAVGSLSICGVTHWETGMSDSDQYFDPPKAAASDLLKRCAVRFGLGIELYSDDDQRPPEQAGEHYSRPTPKNAPSNGKPATPPAKAPKSEQEHRLDVLTAAAVGTKQTRPWVPARLKQQIALKVFNSELTGTATEKQQGKLAGVIDALFDNQDEPERWRHSLMMIVIGKDSVKKATKAEASVLIDWAEKNPEAAAMEAYQAINMALEEAGQQRLPGA